MTGAFWLLASSAALALGLFMAAMLAGERGDDLVLAEWHHEYLALAFQAFAAVGFFSTDAAGLRAFYLLAMQVGNVVQWDDSLQHAAQRWSAAGRSYRSPLWHLYARLLRDGDPDA